MPGTEINGIYKHSPMTESHIAASVNHIREAVLVRDFDPNSVPFSGTDETKSQYIMAYEYGEEASRIRRNLTTLELLKSGAAHPGSGASNIYIDSVKNDYKNLTGTTTGLSVQMAIAQMDNKIIIRDSDASDSNGNVIGSASDNCTILNGSDNQISDIIENGVVLNGEDAFVDNDNETAIGAKVVNSVGDGYKTTAHAQNSTFILTGYNINATAWQELFIDPDHDHIIIPVTHINGDTNFASTGGIVNLTGILESGSDEVVGISGIYTFNTIYSKDSLTANHKPPSTPWTVLTPLHTSPLQEKTGGSDTMSITFEYRVNNEELEFQVKDAALAKPVTWMATVQLNKLVIDA